MNYITKPHYLIEIISEKKNEPNYTAYWKLNFQGEKVQRLYGLTKSQRQLAEIAWVIH